MKVSSIFLRLASLVSLALTNPVPDYVVLPRVTTTSAVATITPGTTGGPASQANPAGSANIGLVSQVATISPAACLTRALPPSSLEGLSRLVT